MERASLRSIGGFFWVVRRVESVANHSFSFPNEGPVFPKPSQVVPRASEPHRRLGP